MRAILLSLLCAHSAALAQTVQGRVVYAFDASTPCQLAGVGPAGDRRCNRVALDDADSTVQIDAAAHSIVLQNDKRYARKAIVGDVLLMGWGTTAAGARVPLAVHVLVKKDGMAFEARPHSHGVTREALASVSLDPWTLTLKSGARSLTALTPGSAAEAVRDPGLAAKLAGDLVEVRENLPRKTPDSGKPLAATGDLTIALAVGPASHDVIRAQLLVDPQSHPGSVRELLNSGRWELRLQALSDWVPHAVVQRDLFLYGLSQVPALATVERSGLKKGQEIVFAMEGGKGSIRMGGVSSEVPTALESARAFLEQSFIGTLLAYRTEQAMQRR